MSRAAELFRSTPLGVLFIVSLCSFAFCWQQVDPSHVRGLVFYPRRILFRHQFYRMITSSFLHANLFHIAANMMALFAIGSALEKKFGTLWHMSSILWSVILVSSLELLLVVLLYFVLGMKESLDHTSLGFSGTIFHLLVVQCNNLNPSSTHSLFGFFNVSSKLYPWVSLVGTQIILPHVSFAGHLCGILIGQLHSAGFLNLILPSGQRLSYMDQSNMMQTLSRKENYIKTPSDSIENSFYRGGQSLTATSSSSNSIRRGCLHGMSIVLKFVKDIGETIKIAIFGRNRELNENIRLNENEMESLSLVINDHDATGEEDEWVGVSRTLNGSTSLIRHESDLV